MLMSPLPGGRAAVARVVRTRPRRRREYAKLTLRGIPRCRRRVADSGFMDKGLGRHMPATIDRLKVRARANNASLRERRAAW